MGSGYGLYAFGKCAKAGKEAEEWQPKQVYMQQQSREEEWIGTDEIDRILNQTYNANKRENLLRGAMSGNGQAEAARIYRR